jgi:hypothetical protein
MGRTHSPERAAHVLFFSLPELGGESFKKAMEKVFLLVRKLACV